MKYEIIPVDTILMFDSGEYSDRSTHGPFRVLKQINRDVEEAAFKKDYIKHRSNYREKDKLDWAPEPRDFIAFLSKNGMIEDIGTSTSWYIGAYSAFDSGFDCDWWKE